MTCTGLPQLLRQARQLVEKPRRVSPHSGEINPNHIFRRDMCVAENTSQTANVRNVRQ